MHGIRRALTNPWICFSCESRGGGWRVGEMPASPYAAMMTRIFGRGSTTSPPKKKNSTIYMYIYILLQRDMTAASFGLFTPLAFFIIAVSLNI